MLTPRDLRLRPHCGLKPDAHVHVDVGVCASALPVQGISASPYTQCVGVSTGRLRCVYGARPVCTERSMSDDDTAASAMLRYVEQLVDGLLARCDRLGLVVDVHVYVQDQTGRRRSE